MKKRGVLKFLTLHNEKFTRDTKHCKENLIYVLSEKKLHDLSPNFHIHVSVSDLNTPMISPPIFPAAE